MKTSLFPMARALCVLLLTTATASAQVPLTAPWDSPPRNGTASGMSYGGFDTGSRPPYSRVSDPASPAQMDPGTKWPAPQPAPPSHSVLSGTSVASVASGTSVLSGTKVGSGPEYAVSSCVGGGGVQWQLGADALYLTRVSGNSYPLLRDTEVGGTALDTADFAHGWEPGYRVTASRICTDGWGIEAAFFALADAWRYDTVQTGMLEVQGPGWTLGPDPTLGTPASYHVWNETEFYSGELNLTRTLCNWATGHVGVRYIRLNDTMQVDELYVPLPGLLVATTTNDLIGPQVGCDLRLCELFCGRLRINGSVNVGVLYNHCVDDPYSAYFFPPLNSEANEVALLGEASLTAKLRLTENIAIRGGYHVLGLNGVALAPDQIGAGDIATEICRTQIGSLIAHGASLGLEVFW